jgi:hypothetical protein
LVIFSQAKKEHQKEVEEHKEAEEADASALLHAVENGKRTYLSQRETLY